VCSAWCLCLIVYHCVSVDGWVTECVLAYCLFYLWIIYVYSFCPDVVSRLSYVCGVGVFVFFFQAEDGIRDWSVTGVQTCALPISDATAQLRGGIGIDARERLAAAAAEPRCVVERGAMPERHASARVLGARVIEQR